MSLLQREGCSPELCWHHVGSDRSDEVAAYAKSIRVVPGEAGEFEPLGMAQVRIVSVPMAAVENRPPVPVTDPRDYEVRRCFFRREAELLKCRFFHDCEGCRAA